MTNFRIPTVLLAVVGIVCLGCTSKPRAISTSAETNYEWHIVVASQGLSKQQLLKAGKQFQELIATAAPGDRVTLISAPSHGTICSFKVPAGKANSRLRSQEIRKHIPNIAKTFNPEHAAAPQSGHMRLPELVNTVAGGRRTNFPTRIVLIGSLFFNDPQNADWSMTGDKYPSHGVLTAEYSPYNINGKYPEDTEVTWLIPSTEWNGPAPYLQKISTFNRLLLQTQDAKLIRITNDSEMAFVFAQPQFTTPVEAIDEPACMFEIAPVVKPQIRAVSLSVRRETASAEAVLASAESNAQKIALAMEWISEDSRCDLDLWVESAGHEKKLSFANKVTPFGKHFLDVMSSSATPGGTDFKGMEWLEVSHNRLGDLKCWINVFRSAKPARVRVIKVWNGQRTETTIQIDPSKKWNAIDLSSF